MNAKLPYLLITLAALICLPINSPAQPRITVDPQLIEFDFNELGQADDFAVTIANDGDAVLRWLGNLVIINEPERQGPRRDDPGDLIGQFRGVNEAGRFCSPIAWDWDNDRMWVTKVNPNIAVAYNHDANYENFEEVIRINTDLSIDGAWANGLLYLPPFGAQTLNRFNPEGQNIGAIQLQFPVGGVAADDINDWLFLMNTITMNIHVIQLEENGDLGAQLGIIDNHFQFHNEGESFALEWVPKHRDGRLWMLDPNTGCIHQIAVDTENWTCTEDVQNFVAFPDGEEAPASAVAHDGSNFWAGGFTEANIRIYDDGITEANWIVFEPNEGVLDAASDLDVILTVSGIDLIGGVYEAEWHILSNDPDDPDVIVMIRGTMIGVPDIAVGWPEEAGFPDILDFNRFGDVWLGHENILPITIRNVGSDDMEVADIWGESEHFRVDPPAFIVAPHRRQAVTLTYTNDEPGLVLDTLHIVSNDPDEQEVAIPVRAEGFPPPTISVDPQEIDVQLGQGESEDHTISLSNDGESLLRWRTDLTPVERNRRDEPAETMITVTPDSGEIRAGNNQDVTLHFELVALDTLPEQFTLTIYSNDPDHREVVVGITIHSLGVGESDSRLLPDHVGLNPVHPNPFNSTAVIEYALPARSNTALSLLDLQGRELLRLSEGVVEAGFHRVTLDAGRLPAGTYLVRLQAGDEVKHTKAVVVK